MSSIKLNAQPKMIVGVSNFRKFCLESNIIVDKSLLIKSILETPAEAILITRPRRWGKSTNLDMLRTFFELETDPQGNPLPKSHQTNYKLFVGGTITLKPNKVKHLPPLKISTDSEAMSEQGQYPVIAIDFKDCKGDTYQEIFKNITEQIQNTFTNQSSTYKRLIQWLYLWWYNYL